MNAPNAAIMAEPTLRLHPDDCLVIARTALPAGTSIGNGTVLAQGAAAGHKIASAALPAGAVITKGGQPIGIAAAAIPAGTVLRPHHLAAEAPPLPAPPAAKPVAVLPASQRARFRGYVRADGRVATRNTIGVFVTSNCAASAARQTADAFTPARLAAFPNVDGVVPYIHEIGCGMEMTGEPMDLLRRTIGNTLLHPNTAGAVVIALGCERNNLRKFLESQGLAEGERLHAITIQEIGGIRAAMEDATRAIERMLPLANQDARQEVSAEHLCVGLKSGGADGFSGLSANPALATAVRLLLENGGTAILSETPDILPMMDALAARAATPAVAEALRQRAAWWRQHTQGRATRLAGPGRAAEAAGFLSVLDQARDALARTGSLPIAAAGRYADPVPPGGLVFMDSPSQDAQAVTGQIAAGAALIAYTTGLGSSFGSVPAPTLKLASNTAIATELPDDIDIDCGPVLNGARSVEDMGAAIFAAMLACASGTPSRAELDGLGESDFAPWPIGVTS